MKCQSYTKEKKPCKNYALEGSHLCSFHEGLFEDFPPVEITALICPYCGVSIRRGAKLCSLCKHSFLICPYCEEPLRKNSKSCSFCKEDIRPVEAIPSKLKDHDRLIKVDSKGVSASVKFALEIIFALYLLLAVVGYFVFLLIQLSFE